MGLLTFKENTAAQKFYAKFGFRVEKEVMGTFGG
jgi:ribosomal protein S18 acetylase RimI-like enzyme